jgi:hypothetical protein
MAVAVAPIALDAENDAMRVIMDILVVSWNVRNAAVVEHAHIATAEAASNRIS